MPELTYRSVKGSALTWAELDDNFRYFNDETAITAVWSKYGIVGADIHFWVDANPNALEQNPVGYFPQVLGADGYDLAVYAMIPKTKSLNNVLHCTTVVVEDFSYYTTYGDIDPSTPTDLGAIADYVEYKISNLTITPHDQLSIDFGATTKDEVVFSQGIIPDENAVYWVYGDNAWHQVSVVAPFVSCYQWQGIGLPEDDFNNVFYAFRAKDTYWQVSLQLMQQADGSGSMYNYLYYGDQAPVLGSNYPTDTFIGNSSMKAEDDHWNGGDLSNKINPADGFLISVWIKHVDMVNIGHIFSQRSDDVDEIPYWHIRLDSAHNLQTVQDSGTVTTQHTITDENFHSYMWHYDGTTLSLFIDGSSTAAETSTVTIDTGYSSGRAVTGNLCSRGAGNTWYNNFRLIRGATTQAHRDIIYNMESSWYSSIDLSAIGLTTPPTIVFKAEPLSTYNILYKGDYDLGVPSLVDGDIVFPKGVYVTSDISDVDLTVGVDFTVDALSIDLYKVL